MGETTGGEDPVAGIRVSDAERDAAVERLSAATGDGRLTLAEFSQRMELATAARTRADLEPLTADLPADAAPAGSAVTSGASGPPSWHVSPIGGFKIDGPWRMGRHVIVGSLVGGAKLDLSQAQLAAPQVTLTKVSLVGGTRVTVPPGIRVETSGFSLIGGTRIEAARNPVPARRPSASARSRSSAESGYIAADCPGGQRRPTPPATGYGGTGSPAPDSRAAARRGNE